MGELSTYELTNFIPFSEAVYLRLFERFIEQLGPAVWLGVLASVLFAVAIWTGRNRVAGGIAAVALAASGYLFLLNEYAELNWAASYAAAGFGAQAIMLGVAVWRGHLEPRLARSAVASVVLFVFALPHVVRTVAAGELPVTEVFGLTPDITAGAAVVLLAASTSRWRWLYLVVPLLWLTFSGLTWVAIDAYLGLVVPVASAVALIGLTIANVASKGREA